ncbi:MAG: DNA-binding protein [Desulfobacterales bacterium]|nr:DNA-binding protein [Desulfobacterales bacterium]
MNEAETQNTIVIYQGSDKPVEVWLDPQRETVWLSQRQMAEIFDTSTDNIGLHLKNIYNIGELEESVTTEESSVVRS